MKLFGYELTGRHIDTPVKLDGISAPVFIKGNETGCIVLHGIGGTPGNVRAVTDALAAAGYTVYAPMLAGHGETVRKFAATPGEKWLGTALDAYDRLKAEGCTRIVPVGLSLGGILTGEIAARRECAGAVLISAPLKMRAFLLLSKHLNRVFPYIYYGEEYTGYACMLDGIASRRLVDLDRLIHDLRRRLKDISCPVFAIWAGRDNKVHPSAKTILRKGLSPSVPYRETVMENCPHGSTYGPERDAVAALVREFIENLPENKED